MNIQMSSSARSGTGNRGRSLKWNGPNGVKERLNKVYGKICTRENWKKTVLSACVVALAIDPLFLFVPVIDSHRFCFTFDKEFGIAVCVFRSFIDCFYVIHTIFYYISENIDLRSQNSVRGELNNRPVRKKSSLLYVIVDFVSIFPIPQVVVLKFIIHRPTSSLVSKEILKWIILCQYLPRIIRVYPLYKEVTRTSGTVTESNWIGAGLNLFLFMLFSYVYGAFWYVSAIEQQSKCWLGECPKIPGCHVADLLYVKDVKNSRFLTTSCPLIDPENITKSSPTFDFGIYIDVLKSGVVEVKPKDFPKKFFYCFWWGLRHLSTFGQGLKLANTASDIFFAIIICISGLFLFAVLIGNVQKYLISSTVRVEEMKERQRDIEKWMSSRKLPKKLQEHIRKYDNYKWRKFRGTEEDALLLSLPKYLRRETKRHLYLDLLKGVPLLQTMDDWVLEALCDRVKSVFYSANSIIVKKGDPVEEMLIVTKGELECEIAGHYDIYLLKKGDICGDLHFWILNPGPSRHLPISNRTIKTRTDVEGFILLPDDLKFVASHLDRIQTVKDQEMFRSLSEQRRSGCSSSPDTLLTVPQRSDDPEFSKDYN